MSLNFDRAVAFYDATRTLPPAVGRGLRDVVCHQAGVQAGHLLLELGVGTGRIAQPFVAAGDQVVGLDLSFEMMQRLRARLAQVPLVQADATRLPFAGGVFQVVLAVHVFHVMRDWQQALAESQRVLRPGGWLAWSWHWRAENALNKRLRQRLGEVVARQGYSTRRPGASGPAEVQATLTQLGATQHEIEIARWQTRENNLQSELQALANRETSETWQLPDPVLQSALQEVTQWAVGEYGSLDYHEPLEERFVLHLARFSISA